MIPTPRPGPRFGDCSDCGGPIYSPDGAALHKGDCCHLAEMDRNREKPGLFLDTGMSKETWLRWARGMGYNPVIDEEGLDGATGTKLAAAGGASE